MASPLLRYSVFRALGRFPSISTRLSAIFCAEYSTLFNKNDSNRDKSKNSFKKSIRNFLTYIAVFGTAAGYITSDCKRKINNDLFQLSRFLMPTVYAISLNPSEINKNRDRYNFIADVVETTASSVVYIEIKDSKRIDMFTGRPATTSNGSGFIVQEDGLILTNAHVVINKPNMRVQVKLFDGSMHNGIVEDLDLQSDLATIRIKKKNLPVMKLGSSANLRPGEFVVAIGSPLSLSNTITSGVISSVDRQSQELGMHHKHMKYIQTDAAITFGNSGGPLVNLNGEAIGINSMKVTAGISFAIPIDYAKEFLMKAETRRKHKGVTISGTQNVNTEPKRSYLGVTMLTLTPGILFDLQQHGANIPSTLSHGIFIWQVKPGSPAEMGGLEHGDIITHVNGEETIAVSDIYRFLENAGTLSITVVRHGRVYELKVETEDIF